MDSPHVYFNKTSAWLYYCPVYVVFIAVLLFLQRTLSQEPIKRVLFNHSEPFSLLFVDGTPNPTRSTQIYNDIDIIDILVAQDSVLAL